MSNVAAFRTGYFDKATKIGDLRLIIREAKKRLADEDFDTIVGTGFSGGVVIPALALALNKNFVLVRKEDDDSHHGGGKLVGNLGKKWIFVDDFVSSGATRRRVIQKIGEACALEDHTTQIVGQYMYINWSIEGPMLEPYAAHWVGTLPEGF